MSHPKLKSGMKRQMSICALWLAGAALSYVASGQTSPDAYQEHLRAAVEDAAHGSLTDAMAQIQAALALNSNDAAAWYQLGSLLGQTGDFSSAEAALRHSIQLDPGLAKAHYGLALALIGNPQGKQDWVGAIAECREVLKLQPDNAEALNLLGAGLNNTAQPAAAIDVLQQALALSPALAEAHFNLALALESTGQLDRAVQQYQAAIAARMQYAEADSALAKLLFQMGRIQEAVEHLHAALRINPDLTDAHYTWARLLRSQKQTKEAAVEFAEAQELTERPAHGIQSSNLSNQALQMAGKGDLAGAIKTLRQAIRLKPDYGVPHYNLGLILADSGDLSNALQELAEAISLLPGQAKPWFDYGRVQRLAKNDQAALDAITWAAHLSPSNAAIQSELKSLRPPTPDPSGRASNSVATSQPNVGAASDTAAAHLDFATELFSRGDFDGAAGEFLRSLALEPAGLQARRGLAATCLHLENAERAQLEYRKVLLMAPDDVEANCALGKLLLQTGDAEGAIECLRRALRFKPDSVDIRAALKQAESVAGTPRSN